MTTAARTAIQAFEFQLAARRAASSPLNSSRNPGYQSRLRLHSGRFTKRESNATFNHVVDRDFTTSSAVRATKLSTKKAPGPVRNNTSLREAPSFATNVPQASRIKPRADNVPSTSFLSPSSSSSLSPRQTDQDQIFLLTHFKKPKPMFVRGLRPKGTLGWYVQGLNYILFGKPKTEPIGPDNVPRLGATYRQPSWSFRFEPRRLWSTEFRLTIVFSLIFVWIVGEAYQNRASRSNKRKEVSGDERNSQALKQDQDLVNSPPDPSLKVDPSRSLQPSIDEPGLTEISVEARKSS